MVNSRQVHSVRVLLPHHEARSTLPLFRRDPLGKNSGSASAQSLSSCVIYGRNGSGKSTLAREMGENESVLEFLDADSCVMSDNSDRSNVFVYNDKYISNNFRLQPSAHLNPIVLLGASAGKAQEEEELEGRVNKKTQEALSRSNKVEIEMQQLKHAQDAIRQAVVGDKKTGEGSWKGRTKSYRQDGQFGNVTQSVVDRIIELALSPKSPDSIGAIEKEFKEVIKNLNESSSATLIKWNAPSLSVPASLSQIESLFESLSSDLSGGASDLSGIRDRIQRSGAGQSELEARLESLFTDDRTICNRCFQDVSPDYSKLVREAIADHIRALQENATLDALRSFCIPNPEPLNVPSTIIGGQGALARWEQAQQAVVEATASVNDAVMARADNPSLLNRLPSAELRKAYEELSSAAKDVAKAVEGHNRACRETTKQRDTARDLNDALAALEVHDLVAVLQDKKNAVAAARTALEKVEAELATLRTDLEALRGARRSEDYAAQEVNKLLAKVYGLGGMKIRAAEDGYEVVHRQRSVTPKALSTGEQNILSLCYFLVEIAAGKSFDECFLDDQIIVLDDPISSFDDDNKYGVLTLLSWLGWQIGKNKSRTKIVILTHDSNIAFDLSKGFGLATSGHVDWELRDGQLIKSSHQSVDLYKKHLTDMYKLATAEVQDQSDIGPKESAVADSAPCVADGIETPLRPNDLRRVWEAFVVFELGENVSDVAHSPKVMAFFEEKGSLYRDFLQSFPSRIFVHVDSHSANQVRAGNFALEDALNSEDYRRFTQDMLCFMYIVAPYHVLSRLFSSRAKIEEGRTALDQLVASVLHRLGQGELNQLD